MAIHQIVYSPIFFDQSVDKAALAEHGIYLVKRKLFYMMNTTNNSKQRIKLEDLGLKKK